VVGAGHERNPISCSPADTLESGGDRGAILRKGDGPKLKAVFFKKRPP
jgi:hypothetical protein